MKIKKIITLGAIAILAIGVMGFITTRVRAQNGNPPTPQVQITEAAENGEAIGSDTDNVEEQVGDQNAQETNAPDVGQDTDNLEEQVGDQNAEDTTVDSANAPVEAKSSDGQDAAPTGTPSISSDAALQAAQAYLNTTASGTATLDDENGKLVYSVDLNGSDVKVDAMSGTVLGVDQVGDGQFEGGN